MDPKTSSQLDPKLQEAYDRVMGVATNGKPISSPVTPSIPTPTPTSIPPAQVIPSPATTLASNGPVSPTPIQPTQTTQTTQNSTMPTEDIKSDTKSHAFVAKGNSGMKVSPVILAVGGVAFLLIYTVIWIKVFNLSVPFINQ